MAVFDITNTGDQTIITIRHFHEVPLFYEMLSETLMNSEENSTIRNLKIPKAWFFKYFEMNSVDKYDPSTKQYYRIFQEEFRENAQHETILIEVTEEINRDYLDGAGFNVEN